ncbi:MAG: RtcB family protein [Bacteroidales bacterium]|nr:RtcB family protein [Bacteroidales bacterium]
MSKLNLRGKDLQRIGFVDDRVMSVAKNIMLKYYKHHNKAEALEILKKVHKNPNKFINHPQLGKIAEVLVEKTQSQKKISVSLNKQKPYKIYGVEGIEKGALDQMATAMQLPISLQGALMPDAHQGYGLPIGGVLATKNEVIPYGVGMDIGCRMCMSIYNMDVNRIRKNETHLKKLLTENTRFGNSVFQGSKNHPILDRPELNEIGFLKTLKKKAREQLGTSGHGNHFVDIGILEVKAYIPEQDLQPGTYFTILSHSGSRGPGAEIARHYTKIAMDKCELPKGARALAWLDLSGEEGMEYWKAMNWAGDYSEANHHVIHDKLSAALGEQPLAMLENHHNFAWKEQLPYGTTAIVHRKGATPAHRDILGIIPGSMASPGYIVRGKGNGESLNSAAHGAGRVMSRSQAKKQFQTKELHELLNQKGVVLIGGGLDESPLAYKDINEVMQLQEDMVEKLAVFKPRIVRME